MDHNIREALKKNSKIWEIFSIGWVGLRPDPNFLTGFKKCLECSETYNKLIIFSSIFWGEGGGLTQFIFISLFQR